jgi:adenosylcobinamide-GDP ribazoletransferase
MKKFLIALQFLTVFPVKIKSEIKEKDFGVSLLYFPLVGLLMGILLSLGALSFSFLPTLVKSTMILILSIFITGGIHLDGFADTCDGFCASKSREEILNIMRDSRIGVMGATGIGCLLLFKFSLLAGIPQKFLWKSLVMTLTFARWSQVIACYRSKYARRDGKAGLFIKYANRKALLIGGLVTLAVFLVIAQSKGLVLFILSLIPVFLSINFIQKKIGGMTGDTIGAVNEIAECAVLFGSIF